jgi:hypothetical protein
MMSSVDATRVVFPAAVSQSARQKVPASSLAPRE